MKIDANTFRLSGAEPIKIRFLAAGILMLAVSAAGYFMDSHQFFFSYLTAYLFWLSLGLGSLFLVLLFHLTGTRWGSVLRRIIETAAVSLPVMAIFFIPVLLGMHELYHWSEPEAMAHDALLRAKSGYLNFTFFVIRAVIYFSVWTFLAWKLYKKSLEQDTNPQAEQIHAMRRISAPGMILFAITSSFAAFDWVMSLEPHWFSTIFGLYIFSGGLLLALSFIVIFATALSRQIQLSTIITTEHYHDLAKLIFSFTIFWGYMAFSQYFLIWYANIPEETIFFLKRGVGSWRFISWVLVLGNFLLPFIALMPRAVKRNNIALSVVAGWVVLMHYIDLTWIVMPVHHPQGIHVSWMDLTTLLGIGGTYLWVFWTRFTAQPVVPVGEPSLDESMAFTNH